MVSAPHLAYADQYVGPPKVLKLFSHSVVSNSLRPHWLQHARLPCSSPTSRACSNSCPSSRWCHPTISSSVVPFSCLQSFPASGSFPMSQFFPSGVQSIGASASVLPVNIQDWFPLGLTSLISLQSKELSRVFSNTTVQKHQFFGAQLSLWRRQWQLTPGKSCLENPIDGGASWAAVHGIAESDTTEWLHFHVSLSCTGEGNGNPLQCSCLEYPREGGAWWAAIYWVTQSQTQLKRLSSSSSSSSSFLYSPFEVLCTGPFEGGRHYLPYLHHSLASGQQ